LFFYSINFFILRAIFKREPGRSFVHIFMCASGARGEFLEAKLPPTEIFYAYEMVATSSVGAYVRVGTYAG
jgi:hypothetical protein